jgi:hypothetical protein
MTWKQALFMGGAVFLLAACSDVTAPSSDLRPVNGAKASVKAPGAIPMATSLTCRTGYSVQSGYTEECGTY